MSGFTFETHYWRAFDLPSFGINGGFDVCEVEITVEAAISVEGTQPLGVNLYSTTTGTFPAGTLTPIGSAGLILVPDQDQTFLTVPVAGSVPPASALVVEVVSFDGTNDLFAFFIGSNADGQTAPSYLSAPSCGIAAPTDLASLGFPNMHIVMTVHGTEAPISPAALDVDTAGNGVFEIGESAVVAPSWANGGLSGAPLVGTASNLTGPAGPAPAIPDPSADYGTIASNGTNNCADTPPAGDCYVMQITGVRPPGHVDFTFDETVGGPPLGSGSPPSKTWALHVGASFTDVSTDIAVNPFYPFIETIFHKGITGGCGGTTYCPQQNNLRQEMAVFLLKDLLGSGYVPPACTGVFSDVPCPATPQFPYSNFIEDLFTRGITTGCQVGPPALFCPGSGVTRAQMSVFLLKALQGSGYVPPACAGLFADVPCPATPQFPYSNFIEDLATRGITAGCQAGPPALYCPDNPVTREQMAVFLTKTFSLVLYGP